jgi:Domain of unknown function (DUF222)
MFELAVPDTADLGALDDAALVDAAGALARGENALCARKLAVMAELFARRTGQPADERDQWWIDPQAAVVAELAAAVNVSHGLAVHQTHRGVALRDRLPRVAALFAAGLISDLLVRTIVWRTYLIDDAAAMAAVDAALAERITGWGALSAKKTETEIDALVDEHDPGALRRSREAAAHETLQFGSPADVAGTTTIYARLNAPDAALIEQSVQESARRVCDGDPRTMDQRRVDAFTAAFTHTPIGCGCGQSDCEAGQPDATPANNAVVYVIADEKSIQVAEQQAQPTGPSNDPCQPIDDPTHLATSAADASTPAATDPVDNASRCAAPPGYVFGAGILPTPLLGAILDRARIREVRHPGDAPPEPRYTPSRALCEFVRCRDLTCRFSGCDKPAQVCDIDHTVPYPVGPTHPSNLKCLCRFHHLLKTFWQGLGGWLDRQLPDGTVIWTSPTGHTYVTYPGSLHPFPTLCQPTATLWTGEPPTAEPSGDRGVMMPRRRHTRAQATAKAKAAERRLNDDYAAEVTAERNKPPLF